MTSFLAVWLLACSPSSDRGPSPTAAVPEPDALGWISQVALEPSAFATFVEPERQGWAALHAHRYLEAHEHLAQPVHRARAAWHLAVLHGDLSRLTGHAHDRLYREWEARGSLPEAARPVASLAARCTGVGDPQHWTPDPVEAPLHALELPAGHPWSSRAAQHRRALEDPTALAEPEALVHETTASGFERQLHDPCVHSTLETYWLIRLADDLGGPWVEQADAWTRGFGGRLFAPWLTASALAADLARQPPPALLGLGPHLAQLPPPGTDDAPQPAREVVARLDADLLPLAKALEQTASPEGRALLADLGLVDAYRQDLLILHARRALLDDRPHQASVLLRLAQDPDHLAPGPRNPPELFVLLAEALLRTGREREALDALHPLLSSHPELRPLVEVIGDLTVLRGLERSGDAREP